MEMFLSVKDGLNDRGAFTRMRMYGVHTSVKCKCIFGVSWPQSSILTWRRRYPDPQGGSPMARPIHCTSDGLTYAIFPNVEDSGA